MANDEAGSGQSGLVVMAAAAGAILCANLPFVNVLYQSMRHLSFTFLGTHLSLEHFVNDGLMTLFFFVVAAEIRREVTDGALSSLRAVFLPVAAALGGVVAPAIFYLSLSPDTSLARAGWAIPTATDIAFSLAVLALLGARVPSALKVFLMTIAVADDLLAIVIIAIFYGKSLNVALLLLGFVVVGGLCFLRSYGGKHAVTAWVGLTALLWLCFEGAGLHATLAGVVAGALMPKKLLDSAVRGKPLEHRLQFAVNVAILPLFAFLNAGIPLSLGQGSGESLQLSGSIMAGLVLGKPLGIGLTCLVLLRLGLAELPQGVRARELWGVAILAGIGFTMSLFISNLSYGGQSEMMLVASRLGVFGGSLVAALAGYTYLLVVLPRPVEELEERSDSF